MNFQNGVNAQDHIEKLLRHHLKNVARLTPFQCLLDLSFLGTGSKIGGGGRLIPRSSLLISIADQNQARFAMMVPQVDFRRV
jgi:hypothetical protein